MTQPAPPALPPVSAEYVDTLHTTTAGAEPQRFVSKLHRSANGMTRTDLGESSIINDPLKKQTTFLDHAKKEAKVIPMQPAPLPQPPTPQFKASPAPAIPAAPPLMHVEDLGKRMIEGHEVMGRKYTLQPPPLPQVQPPALPGTPQPPLLPGVPALPQMPKSPAMPAAPQAPQMPAMPSAAAPPLPPSVMEVWTSTSLLVPMLTRMKGGFGQRVSQCKNPIQSEPHPSVFQVPPGYKLV